MTVYVALGSNLGNRKENLRAALGRMCHAGTFAAVSSLYETTPAGVLDQPAFLNAACGLSTTLAPIELLRCLKRIEWELGRRPGLRWGPRPLDLDILLAGDTVLDTPALTMPHPRLHERGFVLAPLAEVAAAAVHPVLGCTVGELLAALPQEERAGVTLVEGPAWAAD